MDKQLKLALCDDDSSSLDTLCDYISKYSEKNNITIAADKFTNGSEFLNAMNVQNFYDIIFMDVYLSDDLKDATGTDIIRKAGLSEKQQVVFMTTSREHAVEAFSLNAAHYIVKPVTYPLLCEALDRCLSRIGLELDKALDIKTKQGIISVPVENIIYIEVSNKQSTVYTIKNSFQTYTTLDSLFELLDGKMFMRAQRSFVVNMRYIEEFLFDRIILTDKTEIMLSRNNRSALKQQYQSYLFDLARKRDI